MNGPRRLVPLLLVVAGLGAIAISRVPARSQVSPPAVPHGAYDETTDACETCHEPHDASSLSGALNEANQRDVCYSCHDGTAGVSNVKSEFGEDGTPRGSTHPVPEGLQQCTDCHTPHRAPEEDIRLLRTGWDGNYTYSPPDAPIGNDFCYTCHGPTSPLPAPNGSHDGFETSIHGTSADVPLPASGSEIKCLACHESHGSDQPSLTLNNKPQEQLCYECHTQGTPRTSGGANPPWPQVVPGSNPFNAFNGTPNDTSTADGNGIRIYHHPIATGEQGGGTRTVECASCHNAHLADAQDTATTSKIADPASVRSPLSKWIPDWDTTSGYMNRATNVTAYCTRCHVSPTTTAPISAGTFVSYDVRLVNDTNIEADTRVHDKFTAAEWSTSRHGDPTLNPARLAYDGCDARGLTGPECVLTCTACHDFHGTSNAYMLREQIDAPDTTATYTLTGFTALNTATDRTKLQTFCLTCHPERGETHQRNRLCTECHYHGSGRL